MCGSEQLSQQTNKNLLNQKYLKLITLMWVIFLSVFELSVLWSIWIIMFFYREGRLEKIIFHYLWNIVRVGRFEGHKFSHKKNPSI